MIHHSITPFGGRPVSACEIARYDSVPVGAGPSSVDKWQVLSDLRIARAEFNLSDRDLAVLNALLSFYPERMLDRDAAMVVFPSNKTLADRAHGMAESTLRRHLASLVTAGMIIRNDSPNGKRFAMRKRGGAVVRAFGFDLRPLLLRAAEIGAAAEDVEDRNQEIKLARQSVVLLLRDITRLIELAQQLHPDQDWQARLALIEPVRKALRRKQGLESLQQTGQQLHDMLAQLAKTIRLKTPEMSGRDSQNERHYQNSDKELYESEEKTDVHSVSTDSVAMPQISLGMVLRACPDIRPYARHMIGNWHDLVDTANMLHGMMGITQTVWKEAKAAMGNEGAAVVLAGILQRIGDIKSSGAYLRALTRKALDGRFNPAPMINALLNAQHA